MKKSFLGLRRSYKVAVISALFGLGLAGVSFFTVLLPAYDAVGSMNLAEPTKEDKSRMHAIKDTSTVLNFLVNVSIAVSVVSAGIGIYKDEKSKSQK